MKRAITVSLIMITMGTMALMACANETTNGCIQDLSFLDAPTSSSDDNKTEPILYNPS